MWPKKEEKKKVKYIPYPVTSHLLSACTLSQTVSISCLDYDNNLLNGFPASALSPSSLFQSQPPKIFFSSQRSYRAFLCSCNSTIMLRVTAKVHPWPPQSLQRTVTVNPLVSSLTFCPTEWPLNWHTSINWQSVSYWHTLVQRWWLVISGVVRSLRVRVFREKRGRGASLVVQRLIHLSMQWTWVWPLGQKDLTCREATKPTCCSRWARVLHLLNSHTLSLCSKIRAATAMRSPCTAMKSGPHSPQPEKTRAQQWRPSATENNKWRGEGGERERKNGGGKEGTQGRGWRKTVSLRSHSQRTKLGTSRDGSTTAHERDASKRGDLSRRVHRVEHPIFNFPFMLLKILNLFKWWAICQGSTWQPSRVRRKNISIFRLVIFFPFSA